MESIVYRCRVCKKRIKRKFANDALSRGKPPTYCSPRCRNTGKGRDHRAKVKAQSSAAGSLEDSNGTPLP
jgi:hypothetical protein